VEGSFVQLDANTLAVVTIDVFYTLQFGKTTGVPNKVHSKQHPHGIYGIWYRPINGKVSFTQV